MKIEVKNFTKELKNKKVLDNVNITFESGKIYGLHGRNGSGKTMLLRAICGLIYPTEGEVIIDGKKIEKGMEFPENVGLIIENMTMLPDYTAYSNLRLIAKIKNIATKEDIRKAIETVGLDPDSKKKVRAFSLGMKQKLNIAQAIMEHPNLYLLDEPTNALDEETVKNIRDLLLSYKNEGALIIIASHNKEDLDVLCDEIIEISEGKIKQNQTIQ